MQDHNGLILIIDDELGMRETLTDILEDEGYEVLSAETGLGFLFILVHLEQFLGRIEPSKSKYLF